MADCIQTFLSPADFNYFPLDGTWQPATLLPNGESWSIALRLNNLFGLPPLAGNTLRSKNNVTSNTPTSLAIQYGPPVGANDLIDLDRDWFFTGPFSNKKWGWFLQQFWGLRHVGRDYRFPEIMAFQTTEAYWRASAELVYITEYELSLPYSWGTIIKYIHPILYAAQPNIMPEALESDLWCKHWFELALDVFAAGWSRTSSMTMSRSISGPDIEGWYCWGYATQSRTDWSVV